MALAEKNPNVRLVFQPEFMAVRKAYAALSPSQIVSARLQAVKPGRIVIGYTKHDGSAARVAQLYKHAKAPIIITEATTAEMIKLASNCFLAMKVTFANEIFDICEKIGVPYDEVKRGISLDPRIAPGHLEVTPERGWGGACFPKDILGMIKFAENRACFRK